MAFEVPVEGVDRDRHTPWRPVAGAVLLLVAVVGLAAATGERPRASDASAATATPGSLASVNVGRQGAATGVADAVPGPVRVRALPAALSCRDMDRATCRRIAQAALGVLPDHVPEATTATVWRSLSCNNAMECPDRYLDGTTPLGSVNLAFADGSAPAVVNVVEPARGPIRHSPRAWIVRWLPGAPPP